MALFFDQAACCCLFAHGIEGVTAALRVRYRRAVPADRSAVLRARLEGRKGPAFEVGLSLAVGGTLAVTGQALFWPRPLSYKPR